MKAKRETVRFVFFSRTSFPAGASPLLGEGVCVRVPLSIMSLRRWPLPPAAAALDAAVSALPSALRLAPRFFEGGWGDLRGVVDFDADPLVVAARAVEEGGGAGGVSVCVRRSWRAAGASARSARIRASSRITTLWRPGGSETCEWRGGGRVCC